ncbi:hypothetical protein DSL72_002210 [Monilinia vaccinii-corymbosi]|uniref:2EXR domain-containing protein n=1 Tax=Monilinia vaccinii-corymbosi TaxID=61207 RepID=A0A8A3PC07_9HELO|nr:hypothetical protein DSL72_002210 [Monilinia vaccinii-corymbosi]
MSPPTFDGLPAELRLQVWQDMAEEALNPPRAIVYHAGSSPRTFPPLNINSEARQEITSRTDLQSFPRSPGDPHDTWGWFSMSTDIFVACPAIQRSGHKYEVFHPSPDLRPGWKFLGRVFIQEVRGLDRTAPESEDGGILEGTPGTSRKTPHVQLLRNPALDPHDFRIVIEPATPSPTDLRYRKNALALAAIWLEVPEERKPEIKWGCLVQR